MEKLNLIGRCTSRIFSHFPIIMQTYLHFHHKQKDVTGQVNDCPLCMNGFIISAAWCWKSSLKMTVDWFQLHSVKMICVPTLDCVHRVRRTTLWFVSKHTEVCILKFELSIYCIKSMQIASSMPKCLHQLHMKNDWMMINMPALSVLSFSCPFSICKLFDLLQFVFFFYYKELFELWGLLDPSWQQHWMAQRIKFNKVSLSILLSTNAGKHKWYS